MSSFTCHGCGKLVDTEISESTSLLPECCFKSLMCITHQFSLAVMHQMFLRSKEEEAKSNRLLNKIADAAIVSPDPEVRAAALEFRKKQSNG